jgi:hypothetical protein
VRRRRRLDLIIGFAALGGALLLAGVAVLTLALFLLPILWRVWT